MQRVQHPDKQVTMPRGKLQRRVYQLPPPPPLQQLAPSVRQQCCVVCYKNFTPFEFNSETWDSNMIKNFYTSLDIVNSLGSGDEEDEEILSLPFCPQCHTKVSVMAAYQIELQNIKSKCNSIRNDLAFTVVETIGQNSRDGPIDYIRQQIYDKWKLTYEDHKIKSFPEDKLGLEYIACDPSAVPHNCGNFICICHSSEGKDDGGPIIGNGPMNGYEFDALDYVETTSTNANSKRSLPIPAWKKRPIASGVQKRPLAMERPPPLLSPQKASFNSQVGVRSKFGGRTTGIPMPHQRGRLSIPTVAQAQRSFVGGRSSMTPSTTIRRKVDFSHVKPRVPSRFLTTIKGKVQTPSALKHNQEEAHNMEAASADFEQAIDDGKRKLVDTDFEGNETSKYLRESQSPRKEAVEMEEGATGMSSSPRPTRNSSRSPLKFSEEPNVPYVSEEGLFPCAYCPKVYAQRSRLLRHESDLHPECKMYQCDVDNCGKGFSSKEAFKRHVHNAHHIPNAEIEMHRCSIVECQKTFLSRGSLEKHTAQAHNPQNKSPEKVATNNTVAEVEQIQTAESDLMVANETEPEKTDEEEVNETEMDVNTPLEMSSFDRSETLSSKFKRKPTIHRPFGARRRKRGAGSRTAGAKNRTKIEDDTSGQEQEGSKRKPPKRLPVAIEPVRKSSRQRGVHLDSGKPMYPPADGKLQEVGEGDKRNESEQEIKDDGAATTAQTQLEAGSEAKSSKNETEASQDSKVELEESVILGQESSDPDVTVTVDAVTKNEARLVSSTPLKKETAGTAPRFEGNESTVAEEPSELMETALDATYTLDGTEAEENKVQA